MRSSDLLPRTGRPDRTTILTTRMSRWILTTDCHGPIHRGSRSGGRLNGSRFQKGIRSFMGAPVTRDHCIDVLKNGYQRQRILAAHYLCLLEPGTPLFNTSAPAWRQERLLAKMHESRGSSVVESTRAAMIAG